MFEFCYVPLKSIVTFETVKLAELQLQTLFPVVGSSTSISSLFLTLAGLLRVYHMSGLGVNQKFDRNLYTESGSPFCLSPFWFSLSLFSGSGCLNSLLWFLCQKDCRFLIGVLAAPVLGKLKLFPLPTVLNFFRLNSLMWNCCAVGCLYADNILTSSNISDCLFPLGLLVVDFVSPFKFCKSVKAKKKVFLNFRLIIREIENVPYIY